MHIRRSFLSFGLLLAAATAAAPAEPFEHIVEAGVMVPMRDGVKLATDIYRPAREQKAVPGKFPVILIRTPYDRRGGASTGAFFARNGYVVCSQDVRGRFGSEGEFYAFVNEGKDGYDAIEWTAAQPWSNGKVGLMGGSYLAWDQYHASMYRPPHLTAMVALVGGNNFLEEYGHPGGVPNLGWPLWILRSAETSPQAARDPDARQPLTIALKNNRPWLALHPQKRAGIFERFPDHRKMYEDFYTNTEFNDYWKQRGFYTAGYHDQMKDVPILFVSGWYDYFLEGVLDNFAGLVRIQKTPKKLVVGPWPHGVGQPSCGDGSFGQAAVFASNPAALEWFDTWMRNSGAQKSGHGVRLFRMGGGSGKRNTAGFDHGGEWREYSSWPPAEAAARKWFLRGPGVLSAQPPQAAAERSSFVFDPADPVPTTGGRYGGCAQNQQPLDGRSDILRYATEPLAEPVEVTGKVRARLYISSDAVDTDFMAKLVDVYPGGYSLILGEGQLRTRYRNGHGKSELMRPGEVYALTIDIGSISNLFAKGHRIRLDVSSSSYPRSEPNPNTGEPAYRWTRRVKANNAVHHDKVRSSYLELPVVPASR
jgi:putative CocE/NonD family hydrolase